jgi:hypothetical protein
LLCCSKLVCHASVEGGTGILLLLIWLHPTAAPGFQPQLIPQPRELTTTSETFPVSPRLHIELVSPVSQEDLLAAASLERALKAVTGQGFAITSTVIPTAASSTVLGRFDQPAVENLLKARDISIQGIGEQGYVLDVTSNQVVLAGKDAAGLFYGVQTLRQLVAGDDQQVEIPRVRIRDWPALRLRGTQVDLARGPVPKLSYLKRIVRTIAEFKMNQLYLYMEDSFRLKGQPLIGLLSDTLSQGANAIEQLSGLNTALRATGLGKLYGMNYGGTADDLFWHNPFSTEGRQETRLALPLAAQMRRTAEGAYTVFVESSSRARRNRDTLANLKFAALKVDALGMRYEFAQEISQLYSRNSATWQDLIARFDRIKAERDQGKPLPDPHSLGLLSESRFSQ